MTDAAPLVTLFGYGHGLDVVQPRKFDKTWIGWVLPGEPLDYVRSPQEVKQAVQSRGGLIVEITARSDGTRTLAVTSNPRGAYEPPEKWFVGWKDEVHLGEFLIDAPMNLNPEVHVFVPVCRDAVRQLRAARVLLEGLPPARALLVQDVLCFPEQFVNRGFSQFQETAPVSPPAPTASTQATQPPPVVPLPPPVARPVPDPPPVQRSPVVSPYVEDTAEKVGVADRLRKSREWIPLAAILVALGIVAVAGGGWMFWKRCELYPEWCSGGDGLAKEWKAFVEKAKANEDLGPEWGQLLLPCTDASTFDLGKCPGQGQLVTWVAAYVGSEAHDQDPFGRPYWKGPAAHSDRAGELNLVLGGTDQAVGDLVAYVMCSQSAEPKMEIERTHLSWSGRRCPERDKPPDLAKGLWALTDRLGAVRTWTQSEKEADQALKRLFGTVQASTDPTINRLAAAGYVPNVQLETGWMELERENPYRRNLIGEWPNKKNPKQPNRFGPVYTTVWLVEKLELARAGGLDKAALELAFPVNANAWEDFLNSHPQGREYRIAVQYAACRTNPGEAGPALPLPGQGDLPVPGSPCPHLLGRKLEARATQQVNELSDWVASKGQKSGSGAQAETPAASGASTIPEVPEKKPVVGTPGATGTAPVSGGAGTAAQADATAQTPAATGGNSPEEKSATATTPVEAPVTDPAPAVPEPQKTTEDKGSEPAKTDNGSSNTTSKEAKPKTLKPKKDKPGKDGK